MNEFDRSWQTDSIRPRYEVHSYPQPVPFRLVDYSHGPLPTPAIGLLREWELRLGLPSFKLIVCFARQMSFAASHPPRRLSGAGLIFPDPAR